MSAPIIDVVTLFAGQTATAIYAKALELCAAIGLPVTSWRIGDTSRTLFEVTAQHLESSDEVAAEFAKGAYLDTATGDWLTLKADQDYNVTRGAAVYASASASLVNTSANVYSWDTGDLVLKSETTGKTYRNDEPVTLSGVGSTATFAFIAEEPGSASSVTEDDLTLLTTHLGVTVTSNEAAYGVDEQSDASLRTTCRLSTAAISPDGPSDAYRYVATRSTLTGASTANKASVGADNAAGLVTVYVSNLQDDTSSDDIDLVDAALRQLVLPLGTEVEVVAATQFDFTVQGVLTVAPGPYSASSLGDDIETAVANFFLAKAIGSVVHPSEIIGAIHSAVPAGFFRSCELVSPATAYTLAVDENPRLVLFNVNVVIE